MSNFCRDARSVRPLCQSKTSFGYKALTLFDLTDLEAVPLDPIRALLQVATRQHVEQACNEICDRCGENLGCWLDVYV